MSRGCITLLTDFGTVDPYVAAMKGAALSINPDVRLVDISHEIAPQDIADAAFVLSGAFRNFPPGTVHVAVVDPGVGSERRILAAEAEGQVLMAPDNGLLPAALGGAEPDRLVVVTNASFFRHPVSMTFHGRDILAPVAAHLTLGVGLSELGHPVSDPVRLESIAPEIGEAEIEGSVIHVDRFGNLVTNIPGSAVRELAAKGGGEPHVELAGTVIHRIHRAYAEVGVGQLLAVIGSTGRLEVSANRRSAADLLGAGRRTTVRVSCASAWLHEQED